MSGAIRIQVADTRLFLHNFVALPMAEQKAFLKTLDKIEHLSWEQLYGDSGLNWERVKSYSGALPLGIEAIYSLRFGKAARALACRKEDSLIFLNLFSDHDKAYGKK